MALYVGLDISLRMTSICVVEADGSPAWEGKAESEPVPLVKALSPWRDKIALVGIEACPLSEWLYGALVADLCPRLERDRPKGWPPKRPFSVCPNSRHLEDESGGPKSAISGH